MRMSVDLPAQGRELWRPAWQAGPLGHWLWDVTRTRKNDALLTWHDEVNRNDPIYIAPSLHGGSSATVTIAVTTKPNLSEQTCSFWVRFIGKNIIEFVGIGTLNPSQVISRLRLEKRGGSCLERCNLKAGHWSRSADGLQHRARSRTWTVLKPKHCRPPPPAAERAKLEILPVLSKPDWSRWRYRRPERGSALAFRVGAAINQSVRRAQVRRGTRAAARRWASQAKRCRGIAGPGREAEAMRPAFGSGSVLLWTWATSG